MTKVSKPSANGATVTKTVDPKATASCGIPAPRPNGRNNRKIKLADNAAELLAQYPLPAQAQAILYVLDQLGGEATVGQVIEALASDESPLVTSQSPARIWTFYQKRLREGHYLQD